MKTIYAIIILALCGIANALQLENLPHEVLNSVRTKKMEAAEYRVEFGGSGFRTLKSAFDKNLKGLDVKQDSTKSRLVYKIKQRFEDYGKTLRTYPSDPNALIFWCKGQAAKHLAALGDEGQYESADVEFTESAETGPRVSRVNIRYCRKFHGGLVRDNLSYAYAGYDGNGLLVGAEVSWPTFKAVATDTTKTSPEESYTYLQDQLDKPAVNEENGGKVKAIRAKVDGFEMGWVPVQDGTGVTITPAYSYQSDVEMEDGEHVNRIIDFPLLRKRDLR